MEEAVVALAGAREHQDVIEGAYPGDELTIVEDATARGTLLVRNSKGLQIGYLTARSAVARELAEGRVVFHAEINSVSEPSDSKPFYTARARITTADPSEMAASSAAFAALVADSGRSYPVNLVGESHRQAAIERCRVGQPVSLVPEPSNPYDPTAVRAEAGGELIGYLARDSWLKAPLLEERKVVVATILSIKPNEQARGVLGVVLNVTIATAGPGPTAATAPLPFGALPRADTPALEGPVPAAGDPQPPSILARIRRWLVGS